MMNQGPYPSVFCVDGRVGFPPLPPKPGQRQAQRQRSKMKETMLFILVILALFGILVEACFIYKLETSKQDKEREVKNEPANPEALKGERSTVAPRTRGHAFVKPSKPLAHLLAGPSRPGADGVMPWKSEMNNLHGLEFEDGKLRVQKEGYYYIYSKICFNAVNGSFTHTVAMTTPRYQGEHPIELLRYRYNVGHRNTASLAGSMSNSYLGGVFHLFRGDTLFVMVRNGRVLLQQPSDNFFGMFMV